MKKTFLFAALLLAAAAGTAQAQITLTAATHMPQADTVYSMAFGDTATSFQLPAGGANMTWDYSNVIVNGQDTLSYFNCLPQADCASFDNANLLSGSPADGYFDYFKAGNNVFQSTGSGDANSQLHLTDPVDIYRFRFTYNSSYQETYSGTLSFQGIPLTFSGKDSVSGAGYGTLLTPAGTFQNALMLRYAKTAIIDLPGQGSDTGYSYHFEWFVANNRYPVMQLDFDVQQDANGQLQLTGSSGSYRVLVPQSVTTATGPAPALLLSPNPTTGMVRIDVPTSFRTAQATAIITDLAGKVVYQQALNGQESVSINTANWVKGLYFVQLQHTNGTRLQSRLSVL